MDTADILHEIKRRVAAVAPDAEVVLYGSYARGDNGPDSDIDLLILVDRERVGFEEEKQIAFPLFDLEISSGKAISPRVLTRKEWYNRPLVTPFFLNVQREGRML